MKLIYVAGPFTAPTDCARLRNIQEAREVADQINRLYGKRGAFAIAPHFLSHGIEDSGDGQFWYAGTLEFMRRCDAVVLTVRWRESTGAVAERADADMRKIPVFHQTDLHPHSGQEIAPFLRWLLAASEAA